MNRRAASMTLWMTMSLLPGSSASSQVQQATASDGATSDPATASDPSTLLQVTVEGQLLVVKARRFVMDVTAASGFFMDAAVQQWRRPICPMIPGLPRAQGEYVFDHLETVLRGAWKRN